MARYTQRVRGNILPLSLASTLPDAFKEWRFTEHTEDHGNPVEICELCDKQELRYHFEIQNEITEATLMVGSSCILKFEVAVYEGDQLLDKSKSRQKLNRLVERMHQEACFIALEAVSEKEDNDILKNALKYYRENKYFTPKFAVVVLWRLKANNIDHSPSFFKVRLNKDKYKEDLEAMTPTKIRTIWPALSTSQRTLAKELGHEAPS